MRRHELSDDEWQVIAPLLPQNSRKVARVDDRRGINGILWRFRTDSSWRDVLERYGPRTNILLRTTRKDTFSFSRRVCRQRNLADNFLAAVKLAAIRS